ncbi:uncharacterized protein BP01DRAFT_367893 [Aspergillus saccharolyticus JOP 1030-1]|uniref:Uncharacterized protein n=1 Tax=Aspergillus saccharolyticus JOP 1030-1 TaxID=1450539 RepID=A0A318Z5W3_9EURO|nr:hypothetical protein BP01DRAFT_367893 [Aspergillus saccharolyticus JOP 1030-1]PYH42691.1 hypothetical protein BP01DRAFT_367893 [Aspergillus saccharolyticus JOP 1030-1]
MPFLQDMMATSVHEDQYRSMPPSGREGCRASGDYHINSNRTMDPNTSVEDYNRVMLEYTQRRMADFAEFDDDKGSFPSRSSRSSQTSGDSGASTSGVLASQAAGPTSTSAGFPSVSDGGRRRVGADSF